MPGINIINHSKTICNTLILLDNFEQSKVVALYSPFNNEVDITSILANSAKRYVFPRVVPGTKKLEFYEAKSNKQFQKGSYGIMEPLESMKKTDINEIDIFIVPGIAFSKEGERIGYGGGFYDSTLAYKKATAITVGVAFDFQIIPAGFSEAADISVDIIITEKRSIFII